MYIGCQVRDGDRYQFFSHEHQVFAPSLAECNGTIRYGDNSDIVPCLEKLISLSNDEQSSQKNRTVISEQKNLM